MKVEDGRRRIYCHDFVECLDRRPQVQTNATVTAVETVGLDHANFEGYPRLEGEDRHWSGFETQFGRD